MVRDDKVKIHVWNLFLSETATAATDPMEKESDDDKEDDEIVTPDMEYRLGRREWRSRQETTGPMRSKLLVRLRHKSSVDRIGNYILLSHNDKNCTVWVLDCLKCSRVDKTSLLFEKNKRRILAL